MEQGASHKRVAKNILDIPGARANVQSGQLLVSSGIPSVDELLGGGLPVGSITLVEEDSSGSYSRVMIRYFLAEGVVHKHSVFMASQDYDPNQLVKEFPLVISSDTEPEEVKENKVDKMTIAFRYQKLPTAKKQTVHQFGNYYDLSKTMPEEYLENVNITTWPDQHYLSDDTLFSNLTYNQLLSSIKKRLQDGKYFVNSVREDRSVLRLALHSLGSPMWLRKENYSEEQCKQDLNMFMYSLRALLRSSFAVAVVTVPSLHSETFTSRLYNLCDVVVKLEPFAGTPLENNPALSEFNGYFHLKKMSPINTLVSKHPGSVEYVFKLRRKKFCIEMLHLPPDLGDGDGAHVSKVSCSSGGKSELDF